MVDFADRRTDTGQSHTHIGTIASRTRIYLLFALHTGIL